MRPNIGEDPVFVLSIVLSMSRGDKGKGQWGGVNIKRASQQLHEYIVMTLTQVGIEVRMRQSMY